MTDHGMDLWPVVVLHLIIYKALYHHSKINIINHTSIFGCNRKILANGCIVSTTFNQHFVLCEFTI